MPFLRSRVDSLANEHAPYQPLPRPSLGPSKCIRLESDIGMTVLSKNSQAS
jgi:hypothetical protein